MSRLKITDLHLTAGKFKVKDVNLDIDDHQYFVLMGPTGSGKSLLLKAICGLMPVEAGSIHMRDREITKLEPKDREIGYVPQNSGLFPHLSVLDNITFSAIVAGESHEDALKDSKNAIAKLEIAHLLGRSVVNLSGGETQKVALARALARNPQLLILDEPVSAVDEPTRKEICAVLSDIQTEFKITTIHVCHSREEARSVSDTIGVMAKGELLETGLIDELEKESKHPEIIRLLGTTTKGAQ